MPFKNKKPTIFCDRDGVLNRKPAEGDYVKSWQEFEWLPNAREAVTLLKKAGWRILLVTNQAGIGKGLYTEKDLADIHEKMQIDLQKMGGAIDKIYFCPHTVQTKCLCRKPEPGMLLQAQKDFDLDLTLTHFLGDDTKDIETGNRVGAKTVRISEKNSLYDVVVKEIL